MNSNAFRPAIAQLADYLQNDGRRVFMHLRWTKSSRAHQTASETRNPSSEAEIASSIARASLSRQLTGSSVCHRIIRISHSMLAPDRNPKAVLILVSQMHKAEWSTSTANETAISAVDAREPFTTAALGVKRSVMRLDIVQALSYLS